MSRFLATLSVFALMSSSAFGDSDVGVKVCTEDQLNNAVEPKELIHFEPGNASTALVEAYGCVILGRVALPDGMNARLNVPLAIILNGQEKDGDIVGWVSAKDKARGNIEDYMVFSVNSDNEPNPPTTSKEELWAVSVADLSIARTDVLNQLEVRLDTERWAAYNPQGYVKDRPVLNGPRASSLSKDPSKTYLAQAMRNYAPSTPKMSAVTFQSVPAGAQLWLEGSYVDDTITGFVIGRERAETMQMELHGYKTCLFSDAIEVPRGYAEYIIACNLVAQNPAPQGELQ